MFAPFGKPEECGAAAAPAAKSPGAADWSRRISWGRGCPFKATAATATPQGTSPLSPCARTPNLPPQPPMQRSIPREHPLDPAGQGN